MSHIFEKMFLICFVAVVPQMLGAVSLKQREFGTKTSAPISGNSVGAVYVEEVPGTEGMTEMEVISTLRRDIQLLDEEFNKCEKKRKGWVAATVVGGVGVVGTGIAAIAQGSKIKEKKAELERVQGEIKDVDTQINQVKK